MSSRSINTVQENYERFCHDLRFFPNQDGKAEHRVVPREELNSPRAQPAPGRPDTSRAAPRQTPALLLAVDAELPNIT